MAKPKLKLSRLKIDELHTSAALIIAKMTGNPKFPAPTPTLAQMQALLNTSKTKTAEHFAIVQTADQKLTERNAAMDELRVALDNLSGYVQSVSHGDAEVILSAGMSVCNTPAPLGPLTAPHSLKAKAGDIEGCVVLQWKPVRGARLYEVEHTTDPTSPTSWQNHTTSSRARASLSGLPSGTRMFFRVRAVGTAGRGPWSGHAVKMVP